MLWALNETENSEYLVQWHVAITEEMVAAIIISGRPQRMSHTCVLNKWVVKHAGAFGFSRNSRLPEAPGRSFMTPWLRDCVPVFIYRARLRKGAHYSVSVNSYLLYPIGVASETFPLGVFSNFSVSTSAYTFKNYWGHKHIVHSVATIVYGATWVLD